MTIKVWLGREYYGDHQDMIIWLTDNVGHGGVSKKEMQNDFLWDFYTIFGHAEIRFRHEEHAVLFQLTWQTR